MSCNNFMEFLLHLVIIAGVIISISNASNREQRRTAHKDVQPNSNFKCYTFTEEKTFIKSIQLVNTTAKEGILPKSGVRKIHANAIVRGNGGKHADATMDIAAPFASSSSSSSLHTIATSARSESSSEYEYQYPATEGQDLLVLKLLSMGSAGTGLGMSAKGTGRNNKQQRVGGFYIDVGARYWHRGSNTFALDYFHGWSGICIEPDSHFYRGLAINRTCAVVCDNPVDEWDGKSKQFSYFLGGYKRDGNDNNKKITVSLNTVLSKLGKRMHMPPVIDYLSVDIEGWEYIALKGIDFNAHVFRIISIERPTEDLHKLLSSKGYWWLTQLRSVTATANSAIAIANASASTSTKANVEGMRISTSSISSFSSSETNLLLRGMTRTGTEAVKQGKTQGQEQDQGSDAHTRINRKEKGKGKGKVYVHAQIHAEEPDLPTLSPTKIDPALQGYFGECIYIHSSIPNFHIILQEYRPQAVNWWRWATILHNNEYLLEPQWTTA